MRESRLQSKPCGDSVHCVNAEMQELINVIITIIVIIIRQSIVRPVYSVRAV